MRELSEIPHNKDVTYFAKTNFRNTDKIFGIKRKDRRQHMYVVGKSGTGKSVLLENMIIQNIRHGEGVCVVDPHGELVEHILKTIPEERKEDVIYFNPADTEYHVGFNVLEIPDPKYKHLVASGLMGIFTKIWANAWSARMEHILNNTILALLDTPGTTMLGIQRILVDKEYRQKILENVKDPVVRAFWVHEYEAWQDRFRNEAIAPILNKVGQFLSSSITRNVVGQSKSTVDISKVMHEGKIFLVNVSKGRIGEDNSALLGGMIVTKIQLAAMERVRVPEEERQDFYLYVDEFQNFVTDSFASILSEARKYRLSLTLAHQYISQLETNESTQVRDAVFGNVGTMIVFRVGAADAEFLEKEYEPEFTQEDFVMLPNYRIYAKLMIDGVTSRPFSAQTLPPFHIHPSEDIAEEIIASSRRLYTKPREEVEKEINEWSGMIAGSDDETNDDTSNEKDKKEFEATCSVCGEKTTVPFKPIEGLPIYCKTCHAKVRNGEIEPIKPNPLAKKKEQRGRSRSDLAKLGIEFPVNELQKEGVKQQEEKKKHALKKKQQAKTADREGLQNILQDALGDSVQKKTSKKTEKQKQPSSKKTASSVSLETLKRQRSEQSAQKEQDHKTPSEENVNKLKNVLSEAMKKEKKPETQEPEKKRVRQEHEERRHKKRESSGRDNTPPKKEVPEDVLNRILE